MTLRTRILLSLAPLGLLITGLGVGGFLLYVDLSGPRANERGVSIDGGPTGATATYRTAF